LRRAARSCASGLVVAVWSGREDLIAVVMGKH
jgi:hypothetical protein